MSHAAWHSKTPYGTGSADTTQVQFYPSNHGETLTIAKGFWAPLSGHGLCIPKMPWSQRWALRMPNKGYCWVWEGRLYSWARWGLFDLTTFHQDRFGKICQLSVVIWRSYHKRSSELHMNFYPQAACFWSPQHHFNCIKWKIMELLIDGEFLHDGIDDNVMCLFILTSQGLTDVLTLESHQ